MNLEEPQRKKVADWIAQGLKLSEIQSRLTSELNIKMTYMDVRFLVDDLKLTPKDPERPKPAPPAASGTAAAAAPSSAAGPLAGDPSQGGKVAVTVDQIARPGALASGKVSFSDGQKAEWYIDQAGQLGLAPEKPGYRPPAGDVPQFQAALDAELSRLGL